MNFLKLSANKTHLNYIESLRAIAAISVALFHFTNYQYTGIYLIDSKDIRSGFEIGAQGVEVFYIISGFIIPYSLYKGAYQIKHFFHYLSKRLIRLMPPYIVTIGLIIFVSFLLNRLFWHHEFEIDWIEVVVNVFFLADAFPQYEWINPIFATLEVELQFYIIIGLLFPLILKNRIWIFPISIALILGGLFTRATDTVLVNSPYFLIGFLLFLIKEEGWNWAKGLLLLSISIVLLWFYEWQDLGVAIFAILFILFIPTNFRGLNITGKISYSYYLLHGVFGLWFIYAIKDTALWENPVLPILLALAISWGAAWLNYFLIEKPSIKLSRRIKYSKKNK